MDSSRFPAINVLASDLGLTAQYADGKKLWVSVNDIKSIVAEEQTRIDALVSIGALISGTVRLNASMENRSDIIKGDFSFIFDLTPTPVARSLTAYVNWSDEGFTTYFEAMTE